MLDIRGLTDIADYFLVCSGTSSTQIKTIADAIKEQIKAKGESSAHYESDTGYNWIILDYIDVIVHIFSDEARNYYRLADLWGDAKKVKI